MPWCQMPSDYDVQPEESTAKFWVKKPGGAIRRNERIGGFCADSL